MASIKHHTVRKSESAMKSRSVILRRFTVAVLLTVSFSLATASSPSVVVSPGMTNLGNTCYLNSQLECAFHIPLVRSLIGSPPSPPPSAAKEEPAPGEENDEDASIAPTIDSESTAEASTGEKTADSTVPVDALMESTEDTESTPEDSPLDSACDRSSEDEVEIDTASSSSLSADSEPPEEEPTEPEPEPEPEPESLAIQALRRVFQDMEASSTPVAPRILCQVLGIPVFEQQDSQEFWKLLLPALQRPDLTDLYQGSFEDYIKANDGSNRERRREEAFLDLSLDVSGGSIMDGLNENFGKPELLSVKEGNGWRPEKGADKVDALKGNLLRVQGLPSILQIHLKRFNFDWQTERMSKVNNKCTFPEELDLTDVCADISDEEKPSAFYSLQSVVVHAGEYGSGHYYAYVRPDLRKNDWYRFNDHVVTKVTWDEVVADAYGGRRGRKLQTNNQQRRKGPRQMLCRLGSALRPRKAPFGFGGRTSNAYVVQYVRKCDIERLYQIDNPQ